MTTETFNTEDTKDTEHSENPEDSDQATEIIGSQTTQITEKATNNSEEPIATEEDFSEDSKETTQLPKEESLGIIQPQLTYEGAYNGPLYATSEQIGSRDIDQVIKNMDRNGIIAALGMFGIEAGYTTQDDGDNEDTTDILTTNSDLGRAINAIQKYPKRIVAFTNPGIPGDEMEDYLGDELTNWYKTILTKTKETTNTQFIQGLGEIETQEWSVTHDNKDVLSLFQIADDNNMFVLFHPVASKLDDLENILNQFPDTIFIIHMYRQDLKDGRSELINLLKDHKNLYFSMDTAHIIHLDGMDLLYKYQGDSVQKAKENFFSDINNKEDQIIADAIKDYKPIVDEVANKVMWGTETGPEYAYDNEVYDKAVEIARFVIAGFDQADQEKVAYKNAFDLLGEGSSIEEQINIIDPDTIKECSNDIIDNCDEECGFNGDEEQKTDLTEDCLISCTLEQSCLEDVSILYDDIED